MSKRNWFIGGFAVLFFILILVYFFFPSDEVSSEIHEKEKKVSFLEVNPQWADSIMKTLSTEQKAAMLIMYEIPENIPFDSAFIHDKTPGAYIVSAGQTNQSYPEEINRSLVFADFRQIPIAVKKIKNSFISAKTPVVVNAEMIFSNTSDTIFNQAKTNLIHAGDYYRLDGILFPFIGLTNRSDSDYALFSKDTALYRKLISDLQSFCVENNFLTGSGIISSVKHEGKDSAFISLKNYSKLNMPVFHYDTTGKKMNLEDEQLSGYLNATFKFKGLCIAILKKKDQNNADKITNLILSGADLIRTRNFPETYFAVLNEIKNGHIKESLLNAKVKKILLAKTWCKLRMKKMKYTKPDEFSYYAQTFPMRLSKASFTLIKNSKNYLPIRNITKNKMAILHIGKTPQRFVHEFYHYLPPEQTVPVKSFKNPDEINLLNAGDFKKYNTVVVTIDGDLHSFPALTDKLKILSNSVRLIILNYNFPSNIIFLEEFPALIQLWNNTLIESVFGAQSVFGAVTFNARFPLLAGKKSRTEKSLRLSQSRLQYSIPEEVGISSDSLLKIDYIVEEGIRNRAFPGAQVFFALDGKVFYNKSFGTHVYNERQEVKTDDLFDMASVTKVAASTIVAMSTYEKGLYKLNDSLWKHLPDTLKKHLRTPSTLRNITFRQILTHETGLAAGQPVLRYIKYRDTLDTKIGRFDRYYCDEPDEYYCVQVADKFFMEREQLDTMWYAMNRMQPDENPDYRYSDANMNLLYKMLDAKIKNRWRFYLDSLFYKPLGMFNTCYLPIQNEIKPERIVPTENDRYWRKQLLRGYVHDPTAALFGGVAGNAGLFSTAEDIGILFQMLLFNGFYGGNEFFKKETVQLFISQQQGSHRGLGFNRQVRGNTYGCSPFASNNTFGHTGFTGISVWADTDIQLVYVSCTNRVHPDGENKKIINLGTTKRIHNVVYEQLKYVMPDKINLE
jgi:CubicO group peptidase (beta-lactamase class C family)